MEIKKITDPAFRKYGKILTGIDFTGLVEEMQKTPCPDNVIYEPSIAELEALPVYGELQRVCYGELPIQVGYCNGYNKKLNAVEYHRSSELDIAASDAILLLGWQPDRSISASEGRWRGVVCDDPALCTVQHRQCGLSRSHRASARYKPSA